MKKTLITLLALAGAAMADEATDVLYTSTSNGTAAGGYEAKGFAFNLSGSALTTTSTPSSYDFSDSVTLSSISLTVRDVKENGSEDLDGKYIIVITDSALKIQGWSSNVSDTATDDQGYSFTWNFADVTLDTDTTYYAIAYDANVSLTKDTTLSQVGEVMQFGDNGVSDYGANGLSFDGASTGKTGLMFLNKNSYAINTAQTQYAPNVTIVTKMIPEPTTATLSLLALCGLAMRRRRK